ncbi:aspartate aminotransferase family protein [Micromonospora eburnea]|uniref:Glutamate-1-semialdehyde 2,1-aminomutase n=1 Tax=Micromonospora eburnea TaxID=227316 RepID=A0A1C6UIT4_9ACTN|nr:aspartate aminotransferase family protein [Micromonospora eburnea]SCL53858.1 glutamate-1-semialdehyde 2,1-aminomutase [Micromonospora eburnea]
MSTSTDDGHPRGRALWERARQVIPGGVNSATRLIGRPYAFTRAEGAYLWDADGNRYVDYHAAFGAILLGHRDPAVDAAAAAATAQIDLVGLGVTEHEVRMAETLREVLPSAEMTISCMSGSEATAQAARLARGVTGRRYLVKVQGGFHGWHDPFARNVISPPERAYRLDPLSSGILPDSLSGTLIAEYNDLESVETFFHAFPEQIAAIIVEPIPHNVGALLPEPGYLEGLRAITEREGAVLIFDEVITGFRHALGGYQQIAGVTPDLTTFGKAMANGYPVAGLGGSRALMENFSSAGGSVLLAGTYNGHPVGAAAALATIDRLRDTDHYPRVRRLGDLMRAGLAEVISELGIPAQVVGEGSVFVVYFVPEPVRGYRDLLGNDDDAYREFHRRMTDSGFLMLPMSLKRNHISGAHTEDDVTRTIDAARTVLTDMCADGFFSGR